MKTKWNNVEIDLHGQNLSSAMSTVSSILGTCKTCFDSITFITGKGLHSKQQKASIKPELEGYLRRNGYWWSFPISESGKPNTGRYVISTFAEHLS